ncbi:uncharacterized protein LOC134372799 [Cynocephalus volans]|uniref:uncharacterized protein LOC134372799 n=1 Tax=Cynocephalus volans TaxID=110931 RepID=UPI002FCA075D
MTPALTAAVEQREPRARSASTEPAGFGRGRNSPKDPWQRGALGLLQLRFKRIPPLVGSPQAGVPGSSEDPDRVVEARCRRPGRGRCAALETASENSSQFSKKGCSGIWELTFHTTFMQKENFTVDEPTTVPVDTKRKTEQMIYLPLRELFATVVKMPYTGNVSMVLALLNAGQFHSALRGMVARQPELLESSDLSSADRIQNFGTQITRPKTIF